MLNQNLMFVHIIIYEYFPIGWHIELKHRQTLDAHDHSLIKAEVHKFLDPLVALVHPNDWPTFI